MAGNLERRRAAEMAGDRARRHWVARPAAVCCSTKPSLGLAPKIVTRIFQTTLRELKTGGQDHPSGRAKCPAGASGCGTTVT